MHPREMVRIWIAFLHQEKPRHIVLGLFFFLCDREDSNSTALRSRVSNLFYPLRFFCQMRYRPSVIRVSR